MGKSVSVSIADIKKDNPRMCLSALRHTGKCFMCSQFEKTLPNKKVIICESRIISDESKAYLKRQERIKELKEQLKILTEKDLLPY